MDNRDKANPKKAWNSQRDGFQESLKYLQGRMQGKIKSLQRDKKNVKEVHTGFECAFFSWTPPTLKPLMMADTRITC